MNELKAINSAVAESVLCSPIILTGRGGSGTRLLSALAEQCGVFIGNQLNGSADSLEWADLFYDLSVSKLTNKPKIAPVKSAEIHSEHPVSSNWFNSEEWRTRLQQQAEHVLTQGNWISGQQWGWKLPESMLIIPELLSVFGDAKLVHLIRHPISSSLRRSHVTSRSCNPVGASVLAAAYERYELDPVLIESDEDYRRNAVTWLYQVESVNKFANANLSQENYLVLRYEDLCCDYQRSLRVLAEFIGTDQLSEIESDSLGISHTRTNTICFSQPQADEVWALCGAFATALGYDRSGNI